MDVGSVSSYVDLLAAGGPQAVLFLLMMIILGLVRERWRLLRLGKNRDDRMDRLIDEYHDGQEALLVAITGCKAALDALGDQVADLRHAHQIAALRTRKPPPGS